MQRDFKGVWIPKEIWCQNDLNITEKIVLSVVSTLSEQDDGCFANNEYFAQLLNLSKGRVSKIINLLVKKGYLETNFSYYSEMRKVEKRKIKICMEGGQKEPQNTSFEVVNNQGYSQEQPYPLVENSQDIIYKYKKDYNNISSSQIFDAEPAQAIREQNFTEISRNLPAKRKIIDERVKKKKVFEADSEAYLLAKFLERCIAENNAKFPQNERQRQRWAKDFDLMLRIDRIDADDIAAAIEWSQNDNFWRSNILSGKKLREKYQQLAMKMNSRK